MKYEKQTRERIRLLKLPRDQTPKQQTKTERSGERRRSEHSAVQHQGKCCIVPRSPNGGTATEGETRGRRRTRRTKCTRVGWCTGTPGRSSETSSHGPRNERDTDNPRGNPAQSRHETKETRVSFALYYILKVIINIPMTRIIPASPTLPPPAPKALGFEGRRVGAGRS
jgi:hypothetical protein